MTRTFLEASEPEPAFFVPFLGVTADDFPFGAEIFAAFLGAEIFFVEIAVEVEVEAAMEGETVAAETVLGGRLPARVWCRGCAEAKAPAGRASSARPGQRAVRHTHPAAPRQGV